MRRCCRKLRVIEQRLELCSPTSGLVRCSCRFVSRLRTLTSSPVITSFCFTWCLCYRRCSILWWFRCHFRPRYTRRQLRTVCNWYQYHRVRRRINWINRLVWRSDWSLLDRRPMELYRRHLLPTLRQRPVVHCSINGNRDKMYAGTIPGPRHGPITAQISGPRPTKPQCLG